MQNIPEPRTGRLDTYDYGDPIPSDITDELAMTAEIIHETATASIHNVDDMIRAAVGLRHRLRTLAAAVTAERGEPR